MVEPVSLTLGAIAAAIVAKVSEKAVDRIADGTVDASSTAGGKVLVWLRGKLSSSKELEVVQAAPDSQRAVNTLAEVIDAEIVGDDVAELRNLVAGVQRQEPSVYQNAIGDHIVQASNSTVTVTWPSPHAGQSPTS